MFKLTCMRPNTILLFIFLVLAQGAKSQISQGGVPQELIRLKGAGTPVIEMPPLNNSLLLESLIEQNESELKLKPFKFAHAFQVDFSPERRGACRSLRQVHRGRGYREVHDRLCSAHRLRPRDPERAGWRGPAREMEAYLRTHGILRRIRR